MPSMFAWPVHNVTIKTFFDKHSAEKYIEDYPNPFLKHLLVITMEEMEYTETD
jgi:hypothetical protein